MTNYLCPSQGYPMHSVNQPHTLLGKGNINRVVNGDGMCVWWREGEAHVSCSNKQETFEQWGSIHWLLATKPCINISSTHTHTPHPLNQQRFTKHAGQLLEKSTIIHLLEARGLISPHSFSSQVDQFSLQHTLPHLRNLSPLHSTPNYAYTRMWVVLPCTCVRVCAVTGQLLTGKVLNLKNQEYAAENYT